ncbi:histone acetyltransferase HPA2 and related acetyltransferases [Lachnospiraceae bacterium KM106-2]|nr:histone acetyltransferase HPA2 and related acetyltransferases [Lachnospiraceae bacterium KM106-2]
MEITYIQASDKQFWYQLDKHLPESEFDNIVYLKRGYVLFEDEKPIGILRYNLFWDNTPFCTMLYIVKEKQGCGYGRSLMTFWEKEMKDQGYGMIMTSTQVNEGAQHFYRKLGYEDAGGLIIKIPGYEQPMEMFLTKAIL